MMLFVILLSMLMILLSQTYDEQGTIKKGLKGSGVLKNFFSFWVEKGLEAINPF